MKKLAISIGDIDGIGLEVPARSHKKLSQACTPYHSIHESLLQKALKLLNLELLSTKIVAFKDTKNYEFTLFKKHNSLEIYSFGLPLNLKVDKNFDIKAGEIDAKSGLYSFLSFRAAGYFVYRNHAHALLTLPIHRKAWEDAGLKFKGHTDALRFSFKKNAIMMLGCEELFVGFFSEHIPLAKVSKKITFQNLSIFLKDFYQETCFKKIGLLGFNPHAGDYGVIEGKEEELMQKAIAFVNVFLNSKKDEKFFKKALEDKKLQKELFLNFNTKGVCLPYPSVADIAFIKSNLKAYSRLIVTYHDLGLTPLEALYFEKGINVSLNLPIIRVSVNHGTALNKAYKNAKISTKGYFETAKFALELPSKASI